MKEPVSERALYALVRQMVRAGLLSNEDIAEAAKDLTDRGDDEAAREVNALFIEALAPTPAEWEADRRRRRFHVISDDGNRE